MIKHPSVSRQMRVWHGKDLLWLLEVKGVGFMTIRTESAPNDPTGRLWPVGCRCLTTDEVEDVQEGLETQED